ncbi:MAG: hypothetical protein OXJ52_07955 [Oligoflexia bacterium]|nr:hypothetical protein [Oligoflexia bacterium]
MNFIVHRLHHSRESGNLFQSAGFGSEKIPDFAGMTVKILFEISGLRILQKITKKFGNL